MTAFNVYFEIYGKKMKTIIVAESEAAAKKAIFDKIVFHKFVPIDTEEPRDQFEWLKEMMGIK